MTQFEEFLHVALKMGMGRMMGTERQVPVFVPEGNYQSELLEKSIEYLENSGFRIMDLRNKTYEQAVETLTLEWSSLLDKWPSEEFMAEAKGGGNKLLIACGKESHPRFWKYLCRYSLLYTGTALPPAKNLSPRCIVIPDSACVATIIKAEDFYVNYPLEFFGPVGIFNSNTVPFYI